MSPSSPCSASARLDPAASFVNRDNALLVGTRRQELTRVLESHERQTRIECMEIRNGFSQQFNGLLHLFNIVHRQRDSNVVVQVKSGYFEDLKWKVISEDLPT